MSASIQSVDVHARDEIHTARNCEVPEQQFDLDRGFDAQRLERDQAYVRQVVVPWREASERARAAGWPRGAIPAFGLPAERMALAAPSTLAVPPRPSWAPNVLDLYNFLGHPAICYGVWEFAPPFDEGLPAAVREIDGPSVYSSASSAVSRELGLMSLGATVGEHSLDRWLGSYDAQSNISVQTAHSELRHTIQFPGPVRALSRVDVDVDVARYVTSSGSPWRMVEPSLYGPAGVKADLSLRVFSIPLPGIPAVQHGTLAEEVRDRALGLVAYTDSNALRLRAVHVLRPGTTGIKVFIGSHLQAFVTGRVEDIADGFAAITLLSHPWAAWRPLQKSVAPYLFGGGPLAVTRIRITACQLTL